MSDFPVSKPSEVKLGRQQFVESTAKYVADCLARERAVVIGLPGEWGSGKTSVMFGLRDALDTKGIAVDLIGLAETPHEPSLLGRVADAVAKRRLDDLDLRPLSLHFLRLAGADGPSLVLAAVFVTTAIAALATCFAPANTKFVELGIGVIGAVATVVLGTLSVARNDVFAMAMRAFHDMPRKLPPPGGHVLILDDVERLEPKQVRSVFRLIMLLHERLENLVVVVSYDRVALRNALDQLPTAPDFQQNLAKYVNIEINLPTVTSNQLYTDLFQPTVAQEAEASGWRIPTDEHAEFESTFAFRTPRDAVRGAFLARTLLHYLASDRSGERPVIPVALPVLGQAAGLVIRNPDAARAWCVMLEDAHTDRLGSLTPGELGLDRLRLGKTLKDAISVQGETTTAIGALIESTVQGGVAAVTEGKSILGLTWLDGAVDFNYAVCLLWRLSLPEALPPPYMAGNVLRVLGAASPTAEEVEQGLSAELTRLDPHRPQQRNLIEHLANFVRRRESVDHGLAVAIFRACDRLSIQRPEFTQGLESVASEALGKRAQFAPGDLLRAVQSVFPDCRSPAFLHYVGLALRRSEMNARSPALKDALIASIKLLEEHMSTFGDKLASEEYLPRRAVGGSAARCLFVIGDVDSVDERLRLLKLRWKAQPDEPAIFVAEIEGEDAGHEPPVVALRELNELFGIDHITEAALVASPALQPSFDKMKTIVAEDRRVRGVDRKPA